MTTPFLSRMTYNTGYYVSYSVVFPTLLLVRIIPGAQAVVSGFVDGAVAARDYVEGLREPQATQWQPTTESQAVRSETVPA